MITKERLEELIEQNATIYEVKYHNINPVYIDKKIKIYEKYEMIEIPFNYSEKYRRRKYFKNLYETKEEAEWQLEFGNITRTETLGLLTWKQFNYFKDAESCYGGIGTDFFRFIGDDYYAYYLSKIDNRICLTREEEYCYYPVKEWELTKENYIEACRICKKIFLGEDYGN